MPSNTTRRNSLAYLDPGLTDLVPGELVREIPLTQIKPDETQIRSSFDEESLIDLANSIKAQGLLQPIIVKEVAGGDNAPVFEIVAGERRYRASLLNSAKTIRAIVKQIPKDKILINQLIENVQREDLSVSDKSIAFHKLHQSLGSVDAISQQTGLSKSLIYKYIRIGEAEPLVHDLVKKGSLGVDEANTAVTIVEEMREKHNSEIAIEIGKALDAKSSDDVSDRIKVLGEGIRKPKKKSTQSDKKSKKGYAILNLKFSTTKPLNQSQKGKIVSDIKAFMEALNISLKEIDQTNPL